RLLASRADTRDLVERRHADRLLAARAMRADGEAMRLIAQTLQEIEHRVARLEAHRLLSRAEEALAPGVAVRPLGDADDGNLADAEIGQHGVGRRHLPGAAVDQQQVGPRAAVAARVFLERAGEAPRQHLAHHGVVVAGVLYLADVELAVGVLDEALGPGDDHAADRVAALDV